jgi:hypothetical protein
MGLDLLRTTLTLALLLVWTGLPSASQTAPGHTRAYALHTWENPMYDFWPTIRAGELAYFILSDLFLDDTWQKRTMPELFPPQHCDHPSAVCWLEFRKTHSLKDLQDRWMEFWNANRERIYWDGKARCFRLSGSKS